MSSSSSSPKNTTTTTDARVTNSLSSVMEGDFSTEDNRNFENSGNTVNDNSFKNYQMDSSSAQTNSNNFSSNQEDNSVTEYGAISTTTNTTTNVTDGGSFAMVSGVMNNLISSLSAGQNKMIDLIGLNSRATLENSNALVSRSLDSAMQLKSDIVAADTGALSSSAIKVAAIVAAGFVAIKVFGKN